MKVLLFLVLTSVVCYVQVQNVVVENKVKNVRQAFEDTANTRLVTQINKEQMASYFYWAYSQYFARSDVALPGFAKFFSDSAKEERDHADKIMSYINERGGEVTLDDVKLKDICEVVKTGLGAFPEYNRSEPCICNFMAKIERTCTDRDNWFNGLQAMQDALILERYVNDELLSLHLATNNDPHLSHTLEHVFLDEQVSSIKSFGDKIRQLNRVGKGLGEYQFDKTL